jgi:hypothetical protein
MAKASANLFPYVHLVPAAAPASPAVGSQRLYLDSADSNKLKRKDSSGVVTTVEGGGGTGQGLVDFARAKRTSGDITFSTTASFANVDTGLDLVMSAAAGDVIEARMAMRVIGSSFFVADFHTIVGGSPVNSLAADAAAGSTNRSHPGWATGVVPATPGIMLVGVKRYTLVSGDISSGSVTLRLRAFSGATQTISANDPHLYVECTNLGQQL